MQQKILPLKCYSLIIYINSDKLPALQPSKQDKLSTYPEAWEFIALLGGETSILMGGNRVRGIVDNLCLGRRCTGFFIFGIFLEDGKRLQQQEGQKETAGRQVWNNIIEEGLCNRSRIELKFAWGVLLVKLEVKGIVLPEIICFSERKRRHGHFSPVPQRTFNNYNWS